MGIRCFPPVTDFARYRRFTFIVKNGHVTLDGVVANQADKNIVNIRANSVLGVFSVTNNLTCKSKVRLDSRLKRIHYMIYT